MAASVPSEYTYDIIKSLEQSGIEAREIAAALIDKSMKEYTASLPEFDVPKPLKRSKNRPSNL